MYYIAEMSANHNQHKQTAIELIFAASAVGANAIKVQCYTPESLVIDNGEKIKGGLWDGMTYTQLYKKAYMPWEWIPELKEIAEQTGLDFIGTPYCNESLHWLKTCGVKNYKVSSMEAYDKEFTESVIEQSFDMGGVCYISRNSHNAPIYRKSNIVTLACVSDYPSGHYKKPDYRMNWGLSDHSMNNISAILATYDGAQVIEKHLKLNKVRINGYGFDYDFSLTPAQFQDLIKTVNKTIETLKPNKDYNPLKYARSLTAINDIKKGDKFTLDNVKLMRPGGGFVPNRLSNVIGFKSKCNYTKGDKILDTDL